MMRVVLAIIAIFTVATWLHVSPAMAEPMLQMQPLQYASDLRPGERQKGFVDITNPAPQAVTVELGVQGFKQANDKGELLFYDDERLRSGILLDYTEAEIPAHKTLRLYFVADSSKLPAGDVFAAIFARTKPTKEATTSVRLGTLLLLTNGTPGAREATIESLAISPLQVGEGLAGKVAIKNTAPPQSASGFFPKVTISLWPFGGSYEVKSPLVYAGNTRTISLAQTGDYFGLYKITARHGESAKSQWVILVTGYWRWLSIVLAVMAGSLAAGYIWWRRRKTLALKR